MASAPGPGQPAGGRAVSALPLGEGLRVFLARGLRRVSGGRVRLLHYCIMAQPVPAAPARAARAARTLEVERIGPAHPLLPQLPHRAEALRKRFSEHAVCHAAHRDGQLIGYLWLQETPFADRDAGCLFVPSPAGRAAWDYDLWIAPAWRMSRAFVRLWEVAHAYLHSRGIGWTLSCVSGDNRASLVAHERLGARLVSEAWILRVGPRQVAAFTQPPFVDLCLFTGARPTLEVRAPGVAAD
jgi:hypothetical protein